MDEKKWIRKIKAGDRKAMSQLYENYKIEFYYTAIKYSKSDDDAKDIIQDTFITIFKDIGKYKGTGSLEGWMKRILINKSISRYKAKAKFQVLINEDRIEEVEVAPSRFNDLTVSEVLALVRDLPDQYRMVFNLYELDGLSHAEIAELLEISQGTSKSNLHRAKRILKEQITSSSTQELKKKNYGK